MFFSFFFLFNCSSDIFLILFLVLFVFFGYVGVRDSLGGGLIGDGLPRGFKVVGPPKEVMLSSRLRFVGIHFFFPTCVTYVCGVYRWGGE